MPKVVNTLTELEALPVDTEAVDAEGDTARKVTNGWTYRPKSAPASPWPISSGSMMRYAPFTVVTPEPVDLDDPALVEKVATYLAQEAILEDFKGTAVDILKIVKEHTA